MMYYMKISEACNDPHNCMSIISDGMQQAHSDLPWLCNLKQFPQSLPQHLQGMIEHGEEFVRISLSVLAFIILLLLTITAAYF